MFGLFTTNAYANELTSEQYHVLQAIVQQEGGYEYENALWVMSTIQNRVDDERFPDTYWEVITQDGQFESYLASHYEKHLGNIDKDVARAIEDVMENDAESSVTSKQLYDVYKPWARANDIQAVSSRRLHGWLGENCEKLNLTKTRIGGRRVNGYTNSKIKSEWTQSIIL